MNTIVLSVCVHKIQIFDYAPIPVVCVLRMFERTCDHNNMGGAGDMGVQCTYALGVS